MWIRERPFMYSYVQYDACTIISKHLIVFIIYAGMMLLLCVPAICLPYAQTCMKDMAYIYIYICRPLRPVRLYLQLFLGFRVHLQLARGVARLGLRKLVLLEGEILILEAGLRVAVGMSKHDRRTLAISC